MAVRIETAIREGDVGFALIITNDYKDNPTLLNLEATNSDGEAMKNAFDKLGYSTLHQRNVTLVWLMSALKRMDTINYPQSCRRLAFVYAGHGKDSDHEGTQLITSEGKTISVNTIIRLMSPGTQSSTMGDRVRMFFIDACRGDLNDEGKLVHRGGKLVSQCRVSATESNYILCYSTLAGFRSYEMKEEENSHGIWLPVVADKLSTCDMSINDVMGQVNSHLMSEFQDKTKYPSMMQPIMTSTLNEPCVNLYKEGPNYDSSSDASLPPSPQLSPSLSLHHTTAPIIVSQPHLLTTSSNLSQPTPPTNSSFPTMPPPSSLPPNVPSPSKPTSNLQHSVLHPPSNFQSNALPTSLQPSFQPTSSLPRAQTVPALLQSHQQAQQTLISNSTSSSGTVTQSSKNYKLAAQFSSYSSPQQQHVVSTTGGQTMTCGAQATANNLYQQPPRLPMTTATGLVQRYSTQAPSGKFRDLLNQCVQNKIINPYTDTWRNDKNFESQKIRSTVTCTLVNDGRIVKGDSQYCYDNKSIAQEKAAENALQQLEELGIILPGSSQSKLNRSVSYSPPTVTSRPVQPMTVQSSTPQRALVYKQELNNYFQGQLMLKLPTYTTEPTGNGCFQCRITHPNFLSLIHCDSIVGQMCPSKKEAENSAAWKAWTMLDKIRNN